MKRPIRVELPDEPPPIGRDAAAALLELVRVVEAHCPDCVPDGLRDRVNRSDQEEDGDP